MLGTNVIKNVWRVGRYGESKKPTGNVVVDDAFVPRDAAEIADDFEWVRRVGFDAERVSHSARENQRRVRVSSIDQVIKIRRGDGEIGRRWRGRRVHNLDRATEEMIRADVI